MGIIQLRVRAPINNAHRVDLEEAWEWWSRARESSRPENEISKEWRYSASVMEFSSLIDWFISDGVPSGLCLSRRLSCAHSGGCLPARPALIDNSDGARMLWGGLVMSVCRSSVSVHAVSRRRTDQLKYSVSLLWFLALYYIYLL